MGSSNLGEGTFMSRFVLTSVGDDAVVLALRDLAARSAQITADLIAHVAEVDRRKLYLKFACSSMFRYMERLGFSEASAYKRIEAARLASKFPIIFEMVAAGEIHLSG